jgi:hypothetical protein
MEIISISVIVVIAVIQSLRVIKLRNKLADADRAFKELAKINHS